MRNTDERLGDPMEDVKKIPAGQEAEAAEDIREKDKTPPDGATAEKEPKKEPEKEPKKRKKKQGAAEKWQELRKDKRSYVNRMITALLVAFAFSFTFLFFGPFELYASNSSFFAFSAKYLILPLITVVIGVTAVCGFLLPLVRGKLYNYLLSAAFGITVAGYLQGNFLNVDHGTLDGSEVVWQECRGVAFLDLLFWVLMVIIPLAVQYFSRKLWKNLLRAVSAVLVASQLVTLGVLIWQKKDAFVDVSDNGYLSRDGIYTVSDKTNVVVFMLDRFDKRFMDEQLQKDDSVGEKLKGFTYYEDFTGSFSRTCPSVCYLLTGVKCDYTIPMSEYFKKAWKEGRFVQRIKEAGYDTRVYSEINYVMNKAENAEGIVDNIGIPTHSADSARILSAMYCLSMYRYAPEYVKPYYHIYTGDISFSYIYGDNAGNIYGTDDITFRSDLERMGVTVDTESTGTFLFYHLQGSHDPYVMDENGKRDMTQQYTDKGRYQQTKGNLNTLFIYMDMLREKGLYDNTTIVVTADHGRTGTITALEDGKGEFYYGERLLTLLIKPANADNDAPLKRSGKQLCQDNLQSSILSYFGIGTEGMPRTIEDIGEDEEMIRFFWMNGSSANHAGARRDHNLITYKIVGNGSDFRNWERISTERILYPYYDAAKS